MQTSNKFLAKIFPFLVWWPLVGRKSLKADLIAGLTGAVIVLPQGVAFAMIAGMPPVYGLYTAMITPIVAALFGSSLHLVSGPTTAVSLVVFAAISNFAEPGSADFIRLALTLSLLAGAVKFSFGLARMGMLVNFVSISVVMGFTAGAAILIATSQMKHFLGLDIPRADSILDTWLDLVMNLGHTNLYVLAVALATLLSAIVLKKLLPRWPYMLFAMVIGSLLSLALGGEARGISLVGAIPGHLPPFSVPDLSLNTIRQLAPNALAIALLGLIEAVSIGRSISTKSGQHIDANQEFMGQGLSNIVGSFFSNYAGSGSFTRSGINYQVGAKTPLAAIFASLFLMLIVLLIAPLTAYLPMPAMAGVILIVAYNLIDFPFIKSVFQTSKLEGSVLAVTFLATLFLELEFAIISGVLVSLIFYLQRTSKPHVVTLAPNPEDPRNRFTNIIRKPGLKECPQLKIIRIDGSLFFGAVYHLTGELNELRHSGPKNLLIVADGINHIDISGSELLVSEANKRREMGGDLYVSGLKRNAQDLFIKGGYKEEIGEDHFFLSKQEAVSHIFEKLDKDICASCEARVFRECKTVG